MDNDATDANETAATCCGEAAAALSLIVARVISMLDDPCEIVIVRRESDDSIEWQVERRPRAKGEGN